MNRNTKRTEFLREYVSDFSFHSLDKLATGTLSIMDSSLDHISILGKEYIEGHRKEKKKL